MLYFLHYNLPLCNLQSDWKGYFYVLILIKIFFMPFKFVIFLSLRYRIWYRVSNIFLGIDIEFEILVSWQP